MKKLFARLYFWLTGWKIVEPLPKNLRKCVLVAGPHTSNFDFVYGRLGATILGMPTRFLIKKEAFKGPMGWLIKQAGGIPIDRSRNNKIIEIAAEEFKKHDSLYLVITPEGTRKLVTKWRRGFYAIAVAAEVPIGCIYLDYRKRECGLGLVLYPTGNYEEDLKKIEDVYRNKSARHPDRFNLSPMYQDNS